MKKSDIKLLETNKGVLYRNPEEGLFIKPSGTIDDEAAWEEAVESILEYLLAHQA